MLGPTGREQMATHVAETLADMGYAAEAFDVDRTAPANMPHRLRLAALAGLELVDRLPAVRSRRFSRLLARIQQVRPDLVIVTSDLFTPDEVAAVRGQTGAEVVLWFPDTIANIRRGYCLNAPYDAVFFKDPFTVRAYARWSRAPVVFLPEAFHPRRHRLPADWVDRAPAYKCQITTAGNPHSVRAAVFRHLREFDVRIWGHAAPPWLGVPEVDGMFTGRYVADEEKAIAFRAADVVVNTQHPTEIEGVNVRTFEIAGVGGFQLSSDRPGVELFFERGREIETFSGPEELKEKARFYLDHEPCRRRIAEAGERRAHGEHTYALRVQSLLDVLAGRGDGWPLPAASTVAPG